MQRQMASGQVTVPLQFLERPPVEGTAPAHQQQRTAATGRTEFTAYAGRAEFVPVGAA